VIVEAPFVFSIAALSASLAGLAGLVAGLRRGEGLSSLDLFRLREIVEFAFANVLLAVSTIPLAALAGTDTAFRTVAAAATAYIVAVTLWLLRRQRSWNIAASGIWYGLTILIDVIAIAAAVAAVVTGAAAPFEAMLIALLARPMLAFLLVLSSFERH
jgi:hypothetical protein